MAGPAIFWQTGSELSISKDVGVALENVKQGDAPRLLLVIAEVKRDYIARIMTGLDRGELPLNNSY